MISTSKQNWEACCLYFTWPTIVGIYGIFDAFLSCRGHARGFQQRAAENDDIRIFILGHHRACCERMDCVHSKRLVSTPENVRSPAQGLAFIRGWHYTASLSGVCWFSGFVASCPLNRAFVNCAIEKCTGIWQNLTSLLSNPLEEENTHTYIYNYRAYRYDSKSVVNIIPYLEGMNIHKSQLLYYSPGDYMGGAHTALGNG